MNSKPNINFKSLKRLGYFLIAISFMSCGLQNKQSPQKTPEVTQKPNIIIFLADDQGTLDVGCYGASDLHTPNMDRLAKTGVRFTQAYAHTVCCPSRAGLLTGRAAQRTNVSSWTQGNAYDETMGVNMYLDEITLAEILKAQGYTTGMFGKWHIGADLEHGPLNQGFDEFYGIRSGFIDNYNHHFLHKSGFHDLWDNKTEVFEKGKYFPDLLMQKSLNFIDENQDEPFLLYFAVNVPHYPEQADQKFDAIYTDMEQPRKSYAKMVSTTDDQLGQIMQRLDDLNLRENTLVFFMSDNGHSTEDSQIKVDNHSSGLAKGHNYGANGGGGNTGKWRGAKRSFLEGGVRVPAIVSYPAKFPQGQVRDQIITIMDVVPTVCDVLHIPEPNRTIDGHSLVPIINNATTASQHKILYFKWIKGWAVREGDWKLIYNGLDTTGEFSEHPKKKLKLDAIYLANLADEVPEAKNYAKEYPEIVERLTQLYETWNNEVSADGERGEE